MSSKATQRIKGKGWFVNEHGMLYVQGSVDGKFVRKSTGMQHTPRNETYVRKHHRDLLLEIIAKQSTQEQAEDFATFGRMVVESGAKRPGKKGGRGTQAQKDALSKFDRILRPAFESYPLQAIKVSHIEIWVTELLEQYSSSTVSKCINLLREIMHKAVANDIIVKNPVDYIDPIDVTHEKQTGYSVDDARRMMTESRGWIRRWVNLAFTTGMRTGEMMALMWEDIDWDRSVIYLQRSVSKGIMTMGSNGTKNHSRIVPVMPQVLELLRADYEQRRTAWVFPSREGRYYAESKSITKHHFKPLLEELGIEYITLYATRHTFNTIVDNMMVDEATVTQMVGNSPEVRRDHYVDYQVTDERVAHAHKQLSPVNSVFFMQKQAEVK